MSIWGSLVGGMIGFSLGGPFGMLLGSLLRGKISRATTGAGFSTAAHSQKMFALSLIVLSAKLSKVDGRVCREEVIAVKDKLNIPENELHQVSYIEYYDKTEKMAVNIPVTGIVKKLRKKFEFMMSHHCYNFLVNSFEKFEFKEENSVHSRYLRFFICLRANSCLSIAKELGINSIRLFFL